MRLEGGAAIKHSIAETLSGVPVYVDLVHSPAASQISMQPYLISLAKEVLTKTAPRTIEAALEHNMGRDIGYDFVAETTSNDSIFYAQIVRTNIYTRFVKNKKALATPYLTIILRQDSKGEYELLNTWIGRLTPPQPGGHNETPESKPYWSSHACIFDRQPLQSRTITRICPY